MRCGCPQCGTYMIQSEGSQMGCVCPDCLYRCKACLGTDSVVSREHFEELVRIARSMGNGPKLDSEQNNKN